MLSNTLLTISNQLRSHFNMGYSTDKMLPVESTPGGQSNLVSVEYTCIRILQPRPIMPKFTLFQIKIKVLVLSLQSLLRCVSESMERATSNLTGIKFTIVHYSDILCNTYAT